MIYIHYVISSTSDSLSEGFLCCYTLSTSSWYNAILFYECKYPWFILTHLLFYLEDKGRHFKNFSLDQIAFVSNYPWFPGTYTFSNHCFPLYCWQFKDAETILRHLRGWDFVSLPVPIICRLFSEFQNGYGTSVLTHRKCARKQR